MKPLEANSSANLRRRTQDDDAAIATASHGTDAQFVIDDVCGLEYFYQ